MFQQLLTPVAGGLLTSFIVAALPIATVLLVLGVLRRPAWQASLSGLVVGLLIAIGVWQFPIPLALNSVAAGMTFAVWPVMWIVFNALLLYNVAVKSGSFDAFRDWILDHLPNDKRVILVIIGFCFGALLEGIAGLRHARRDHELPLDHGRFRAARGARLYAHLRYGARRIRPRSEFR